MTEYTQECIARRLLGESPEDIRTYSPGALAYLGDGVYELMVRTKLVNSGNRPADRLQSEGMQLSRASFQAAAAEKLLEAGMLTEEELSIYRRGRNTDTHNHARSASHGEYRKATGLETLFGFLYLSGRDERLKELFAFITGLE